MQKLLSILLATLILFQSLQFKANEILLVDDFINHAKQHLNNGDSFITFLDMHYGNKTKEHFPDHQEHNNLPFHGNHDFSAFQTLILPSFNTLEFDNSVDEFSINQFFYIDLYSFFSQTQLIQPPIFRF